MSELIKRRKLKKRAMYAIRSLVIIILANINGYMMECRAGGDMNLFIDSIFDSVYQYYGYAKNDVRPNLPSRDKYSPNAVKDYLKVLDNICGNGKVEEIYYAHRVFNIGDFTELEDSVRSNAKYLSKELIDEILLEYNIMQAQIMGATDVMENSYGADFDKAKRRYQFRKEIGEGLQSETVRDTVAAKFFYDFIKDMQCYFNTTSANYRINSISIPYWSEREWCVISFFTDGDIVFKPGNNCIDRETFNVLKDWYWINKGKLESVPIKEILDLYDNITGGITRAVDPDSLSTKTEYAEIARKIDRLNLYPFTKIREFIDDIDK